MKTITLGPFLGINTRRPDFALGTEVGSYVRAADNVDITATGSIARRAGDTLIQAMGNAHSLMMVTSSTGFLVRASALYAVTLPAYSEALITTLDSDAAMSYVSVADDWYYSNGTDIGRVTLGVAYPIGLQAPSAPGVSSADGGLPAGQYQVAISYSNAATGEEGALSDITPQENTDLAGLQVSLPAGVPGATHVNVYATECNGTALLLATTVPVGTAAAIIVSPPSGRTASTQSEALLPAGTLFYADGKLCSFKDHMVYVGTPYRFGYYLPLSGFIPFPCDVSIAIANENGTYVAADKTYFVPGDLSNVQEKILDVMPCGAVPGTAFHVLHSKEIGWFSRKGFVVISADGAVNATMTDNMDIAAPSVGFCNMTDSDGLRKVSGCGYSMNLDSRAVTTYSGWAFTSKSRQYGTKADGIYQDDAGAPVNAVVNFGKQDFGSEHRKALPALYLGCSSTAPLRLRVKTPGADYTYAATSSSVDLQQQRVVPGKGLMANWFELELSNQGDDFALATIAPHPLGLTRRI